MLSVESAQELLLANMPPLPRIELVPLIDADNRICAEDIYSSIDVPQAANSAMDGFALNTADLQRMQTKSDRNPLQFPVSQRIVAGAPPKSLEAGTAARIFTGAEIPPGADAVIMQEECQVQSDSVTLNRIPVSGENIRQQGQDIKRNSLVIEEGTRLRPQEIGLLASTGRTEIPVYKKLRIALLSTGDELVDPGRPLQPGEIYSSNRFTLECLIRRLGMATSVYPILRDDLRETEDALKKAARENEVVLTTGGVSVGEEDHVRTALQVLGELEMWKVAMKPGKPIAFGLIGSTPFIGLPGNPVSVFATWLILARNWLLKAQGANEKSMYVPAQQVQSAFSRTGGSRKEYLRARLGKSGAEIYSNQSSGVLSSVSWSTGFVIQDIGQDIQSGDQVTYISYQDLY